MDFSAYVHVPFTYGLAFLVALTVIVFIHELGHFLVARWCGVRVDVFSIGFGKEITGWVDRQGTRWKLCWLPLGGYVKFHGDANAASMPGERQPAQFPGNFHTKPVWQRAAVVVAGPLANFILAIAIFAAAFSLVGVPIVEPRVDKVVAGGAADRAGIKPGDVIVEVEGKAVENFSDLQEIIIARPGEAVYLIVDRGGSHVAITVVPELKEESDGFGGKVRLGRIGVEHNSSGDIRYKRLNPLAAVAKGAERSWYIVSTTFNYLGKLFTGRESADQISGPAGIVKAAGDAASLGFLPFVTIVAFLSVSIGLINLFPIPMLDGGHLVYYGIEAIRGKPLGPDAQEWGFRIGFSLVIMLMLVGTWNDLGRFVAMIFGGS
jgi:regulator of sigma E protease